MIQDTQPINPVPGAVSFGQLAAGINPQHTPSPWPPYLTANELAQIQPNQPVQTPAQAAQQIVNHLTNTFPELDEEYQF